jgi:hypothetical protein
LKKKDYNYVITDSPPLSVIQQTWKDRVLELWEERTSEERLQSSKETKRWTVGEKLGRKCNR